MEISRDQSKPRDDAGPGERLARLMQAHKDAVQAFVAIEIGTGRASTEDIPTLWKKTDSKDNPAAEDVKQTDAALRNLLGETEGRRASAAHFTEELAYYKKGNSPQEWREAAE